MANVPDTLLAAVQALEDEDTPDSWLLDEEPKKLSDYFKGKDYTIILAGWLLADKAGQFVQYFVLAWNGYFTRCKFSLLSQIVKWLMKIYAGIFLVEHIAETPADQLRIITVTPCNREHRS